MLSLVKAILRKTRKAAEIIMKTEKNISCEEIPYSPDRVFTWFFAHRRNLLRYSHVGAGLGFRFKYLRAQPWVCHPDLDQFWHSGCAVLSLALPPVCPSDLYSALRRNDGYKWWDLRDCNGCMLPSSHHRCSTCVGLKCCSSVSHALPAPIHACKLGSEPDWHSCDVSHLLSRAQEITASSNITARPGD